MLPELYHAHHNRNLEDLPFWLGLAAEKGDPVLELGCGTGRVLIPLAQAGHQSIGLDQDQAMLSFLRSNIGPMFKPTPLILITDMCRFTLTRQFPLIILPCNTFSTLSREKRRDCLHCVRDHLLPGGIFAASVPNPEYLSSLPFRSEPEIEDEFILQSTGNPVQVSSAWQRSKDSFRITWIYDHLHPDGRVERYTVSTAQHVISADEYLDEIRYSGLKIAGIYGDYDRSPHGSDSPYLIFLAMLSTINNPK